MQLEKTLTCRSKIFSLVPSPVAKEHHYMRHLDGLCKVRGMTTLERMGSCYNSNKDNSASRHFFFFASSHHHAQRNVSIPILPACTCQHIIDVNVAGRLVDRKHFVLLSNKRKYTGNKNLKPAMKNVGPRVF